MRTDSVLETRLWIAAVAFALSALAVGALVAHRGPGRLDIAAQSLRGTAVPLALFFTLLGRWPVLIGIGVVAFGVAMALRAGAGAVAVVLGAQVISQAANALVKLGFQRARPGGEIGVRETDLSFPSGHSVTAIVFFVGFAILAWHAPLPRPWAAALTALLVACAVGIPWSRLALGAHYATDVAGGLLLGAGFLCAALATVLRFVPATAQ
ncbi:MAG TPA: phosphatase PAP2 family protein [Candidatus Limnocylindrales bacterium]|nr:phosphatase PAP2 family protein [Candidatus Limnocylindrales bacterium]